MVGNTLIQNLKIIISAKDTNTVQKLSELNQTINKSAGMSKALSSQRYRDDQKSIQTMNRLKVASMAGFKTKAQLNRIDKNFTDTQLKNNKVRLAQTKVLAKARVGEAKRFKGEYMGYLFAGMALQRAFGGLFKSMIEVYKQFTKTAATPLSKALTRLEANWKFLKFSMLDAAGPVLSGLANAFAGIAHYIAGMNPTTLQAMTILIGSLAVLGGVSMVFGQAALFFTSIASAALMKDGINSMGNMMQQANGLKQQNLVAGTSFFNAWRLLAIAGGAIALAWGISKTANIIKDASGNNFGDILAASLATGIGVGLLTGSAMIGAGAGVIAMGLISLKMIIDTNKSSKYEAGLESLKTLQEEAGGLGIFAGGGGEDAEKAVQFVTDYADELSKIKILQEGAILTPESKFFVKKEMMTELTKTMSDYAKEIINLDTLYGKMAEISGLDFLSEEEVNKIETAKGKAVEHWNKEKLHLLTIVKGHESIDDTWEEILTKSGLFEELYKKINPKAFTLFTYTKALKNKLSDSESILRIDFPEAMDIALNDPVKGIKLYVQEWASIWQYVSNIKSGIDDIIAKQSRIDVNTTILE